MKTLQDLTFHKDPKVFRINELPDHAYFIPFESPEKTRLERERSAYFQSLTGPWKYLWKPSFYDMDDFYKTGFDLSEFETVCIPENWQTHGRDRAQYQTSPYPFLVDPPHIPERNPCAAYVKDFQASPVPGKRYELHLEGKDSCAYVWLNGEFVGYGEVPHCDSAFDVTPWLRSGSNRLCVLVLKWCSGSYLDDQDKIRLSGLFRDVYLLTRSEKGLRDFSLQTDMDGNLSLTAEAEGAVTAEIYDGETLLCQGLVDADGISLKTDKPRLWTAETPNLYDLVLSAEGEFVRHRFGFRESAVQNGVFTVNRRHVKLYGVNRHDSHPETGYVVDLDFMRRELLLMKQHNINAIRTAHYPNDPRFYALCDELGFYLVSEADLECHGFLYLEQWDRLAKDPDYADAMHDRMVRMYCALRNVTSIVIWSIGNESSWGENLKNEALWLRNTDPSRPVHYESVYRIFSDLPEADRCRINDTLDFTSRMYPTFETIAQMMADPAVTTPFILCEYSHAMGNSCGDLRFYDDLFQTSDRYAGGFIWEWCDHTMVLRDENGQPYFGYGGDFGELHHRRNFCMDGVVAPDRRPHSGLLEAKAVFAPVRVEQNSDHTLTVKNRHAFSDFSGYDLRYTVTVDGRDVDTGRLYANPAPGEKVTIPCPAQNLYHGDTAVLTVSVLTKEPTPWADRGHTVTAFSFPLPTEKAVPVQGNTPPVLEETRAQYTVSGTTDSGKAFAYTFRKDRGLLTQVTVDGQALLKAPMTLNCFRAPIDNDNSIALQNNILLQWTNNQNFGNIEYTETNVKNFRAELKDGCAVLAGDFIFGVQGRKHISMGSMEVRIDGNGVLTISQNAQIHEDLPYFLPRYGYIFALNAPAENMQYFGYGPAECYEDKRSHACLGYYDYIPDDPADAYEHPQECGSHWGTEQLCLRCGNVSLSVSGSFSFSASRYDLHDVAAARHMKDLKQTDGTFLYIDYRMSGVGSASCGGQYPIESCRINANEKVCHQVTLRVD